MILDPSVVVVTGNNAKIIISGREAPATIEDLGDEIRSEVKQIANMDLRFLPSKSYKFP
jgi:hypothetical protein